jgi:two-component system, sensor histidine kinase and response regulator
MKNPGQGSLEAPKNFRFPTAPAVEKRFQLLTRKIQAKAIPRLFYNLLLSSISLPGKVFNRIQLLGVTAEMEDFEQRKLRVFNLLNFFQFIFGVIIPITALIYKPKITTLGWVAACLPALVSLLVLFLNSKRHHQVSTLAYFILYPVITSIVYLSGMNLGIELFFILYGILAVFFIQEIGHMIFTVTLSMISYFVLTVMWRNYQFHLEVNGTLYLMNHLIAIVFIFLGLYLVKKENADYQLSILNHNRILREKNDEIEGQKKELADNSDLLNIQAVELRELNALKNKLFSVIAHDLKSPMYALRNLFMNIQQYDLPANEVKKMVPEIMNDLNYTTSLMENLLQWARCQMHSLNVTLEPVNIAEIADEVVQLMNSQATLKRISLVNSITEDCFVQAHPDMIRLVLRNLVSNAIKFTPQEGYVTVGMEERPDNIEIYVLDTGIGIQPDLISKIHSNEYFSTHGTADEKGTGLGLMLCREFLAKNESALEINSEPGDGSRFSFILKPAASPSSIELSTEQLSSEQPKKSSSNQLTI